LLVGIVFVLILITRTVDFSAVEGSAAEAYLSTVAVQLFIFILPCVLYIRYRSLDVRETLRIRIPAPDKIMFIALCSLFLILMSILMTALSEGGSVYSPREIPADPSAVIYFAVCFALVPALCEEPLFRAVVMSEYRQTSVVAAALISSLYFSMMHFDIARFPFYFLSGIVLSVCAYAANSVIASFFVHLIYNLFAIFGGGVVERVLVSLSEPIPVMLVLGALLLLTLSLILGECQRIYAGYAKRNRPSEHVVKHKKGTGGMRFALALLSPTSLLLVLMFIITVLVQ
jgi:membrane protease YdiL (CAAX protease family)